MPSCQNKKQKNSQLNISSTETSYPNTASLKYFNEAESEKTDVKSNFMKMIEVLRGNKSLKEIKKRKSKLKGYE